MGKIGLIKIILQVKAYSFEILCFAFVQSFKGAFSLLIRLMHSNKNLAVLEHLGGSVS